MQVANIYWNKIKYKEQNHNHLGIDMSCPLCDEPKLDFYNLMKKYCSNVDQMKKDICEIHRQPLSEMALNFWEKGVTK